MSIAVFCGLVIFVLLAVMLLAGVPIAIALAVSSICAILPVLNLGASVLTGAQRIFSGISVFSLLAIPFFILAGNIMNKGGIAIRLINFAKLFTGSIPGALAHTNADYDSAMAAFDAGACHLVHMYNAMSPFTHRAPGVIGAAADSPHVMAEIICDGVHIHPSAVRGAFALMGEERMIFISDSMRAAGMPDGI